MELVPCLIVLLEILTFCAANNDWTLDCSKCKCLWSSGKKTADCKGANLMGIPKTLSKEIRDIDFTGNNFRHLFADEFREAKLENIHKLKLQNCSIENIDKNAFEGLQILIELDLSYNQISTLYKTTFRDNNKLRVLSLSNNRLKHLEDGLFYNMSHLQHIFIDYNELESISKNVFNVTPSLKHIGLSYNKIKRIDYDFTMNFEKLVSLSLEGNPWHCDCYLDKFRNLTITKNLVTSRIECKEPQRLFGKEWNDNNVVFACNPTILEPHPNKMFEAESANITLTCKVTGTPPPSIDWKSNGRILDRDPRQNTQKYITTRERIGDVFISHLTIININYRDRGEYKCIATNPGGEEERNISLVIRGSDGGGAFGNITAMSGDLTLIIILSVGAVVLLFVIFILVLCCCKCNRRNNNILSKNRSMNQSSEYIHMDSNPEIEKALITDVNPLVKPPRQYSLPPSVTSGGTEVSEAKKMLIDDDSIISKFYCVIFILKDSLYK